MTARLAALLLAAAPLAACGASVPNDEAAGPRQIGVLTIEPQALATRLDAGEPIELIDLRPRTIFAEGHLPGAINMPLDTFDPAALLPLEGRERILYCRGDRCSAIAAQRLAQYENKTVVHLKGGIKAWEDAGLPIVR